MADVNVKQCDVYGTYKGVQHYHVLLVPHKHFTCDRCKPWEVGAADLSPRALKRCRKGITRGLTSPSKAAEDGKENVTAAAKDDCVSSAR